MNKKLIAMTITAMLLLAVSYTYALEQKDILVYYSFDNIDGKTIRDESGNGNDAQLVNDGTLVDGQFGKAIHLNGGVVQLSPADDFVVPIGVNGEATLEAWFNMKSHSGHSGIVSIETIDAGCCEFRMMLNPSSNPFWDAGHHKDKSLNNFTFDLDTWYHYVLVADGKEGKAYVDGEFIGSHPENITFRKFEKAQIFVGAGEGPTSHPAEDVIIDEVVIYSKALSADEVKASKELGVKGALAVEAEHKLALTWGQLKSDIQ